MNWLLPDQNVSSPRPSLINLPSFREIICKGDVEVRDKISPSLTKGIQFFSRFKVGKVLYSKDSRSMSTIVFLVTTIGPGFWK